MKSQGGETNNRCLVTTCPIFQIGIAVVLKCNINTVIVQLQSYKYYLGKSNRDLTLVKKMNTTSSNFYPFTILVCIVSLHDLLSSILLTFRELLLLTLSRLSIGRL